jgi:hypothetical protein
MFVLVVYYLLIYLMGGAIGITHHIFLLIVLEATTYCGLTY